MLTFLFWFFGLLSIFSYVCYPLILKISVLVKNRRSKKCEESVFSTENFKVSLIVTAFNEESRVREKLENSLTLRDDFPDLEIIVASDCSDDSTDDIVKEYAEKGVILVRSNERLGKENAQLCAIKKSVGDILIFSDVATFIPQGTIPKLLNYFRQSGVGSVSSEDRFVSQDGSLVGEGAYVKYEMWLRRQESEMAGLVGLSGSFFATRRELCQDWDIHSPSDFNTALNTAKGNLISVTAPDVNGYYQDLKDPSKEYQRKVRTVIRGMTGLSRHVEVLNPAQFGFFAIQVISHKLMRWLTPWFLIIFFIINTMLANEGLLYFSVFIGQLLFYGVAAAAHFIDTLKRFSITRIIYFFVSSNIALLDAATKFLSGQRMTTWKPSAR